MMRSLYSGVSGLQNHQTRMDVIGNNISNVNTIGFKKGRVTFQDLFSQYYDSPSGPNEVRGGINPKQVGLGMSVASIDTIFTEGSLQTTGVKTDLSIAGNGFFVQRKGDEYFYTRAGAFDVDSQGALVNPANGMRVQGWNAQFDGVNYFVNTTGPMEDIEIPLQVKDPARATSLVRFRSNLDKNTPEIPVGATPQEIREGTWTSEQEIFDAFGNTHLLQLNFTKEVGAINQWRVNALLDPGSETPLPLTLTVGGIDSVDSSFLLNFDNNGILQNVTNDIGGTDADGDLEVTITYTPNETNPEPGATGALLPRIETFQLNVGQAGNFVDGVTQFASASSTKGFFQDGKTMGYLKDFRIDDQGNIVGIYTNQENRTLGQIALATFANPEGLEKTGETNFVETINSGQALIGEANEVDRGSILSGKLELSNVDLAEEFTDMIVTQRGFQANSRTIRTSDQMIQELLTLKQ